MEQAPALHARSRLAQALAQEVQTLAVQRDSLRRDMACQVQQASARVQQEKERLAALIAELEQCVLVCNLDGRILLYNYLARKALGAAQHGGVVGIGRSVYGLLDRGLMHHALHTIRQRLARGPDGRPRNLSPTRFPAEWLRVQMTPVLAQPHEVQAQAQLSGFVLLLEDVTHSFALERERDSVLHSLTEEQPRQPGRHAHGPAATLGQQRRAGAPAPTVPARGAGGNGPLSASASTPWPAGRQTLCKRVGRCRKCWARSFWPQPSSICRPGCRAPSSPSLPTLPRVTSGCAWTAIPCCKRCCTWASAWSMNLACAACNCAGKPARASASTSIWRGRAMP